MILDLEDVPKTDYFIPSAVVVVSPQAPFRVTNVPKPNPASS